MATHIDTGEHKDKDINEFLFPPDNDKDKEDFYMTRTEAEQLTNAFKDEGFRKLFVEYVEELQDPDQQATFQREMRELERQRGNVIHFVNPVPGYVLKSSINGEKKGFINICSNPLIKRAHFQDAVKNNEKGSMWSIPYAQSPPREDVDKSGSFCLVYDIIFHPDTLSVARTDKTLHDKLESTAVESIEKSFNVTWDKNNVKRPKVSYKGLPKATAIKYPIGSSIPTVIDPAAAKNEIPPQRPATKKRDDKPRKEPTKSSSVPIEKPKKDEIDRSQKTRLKHGNREDDNDEDSWTKPRHSIKYRSHIDMQDYTLDDNNRKFGNSIPHEMLLTIDLPLLRDSSTLDADVTEGGAFFELKSEQHARYKLKLKLPYLVNADSAKATFDKDKRKLTVTMKIVQRKSSTAKFESGAF